MSFACDFDGPCCESYGMNFPGADVREENVSDLTVSLERKDMRYDLVHVSICHMFSFVFFH